MAPRPDVSEERKKQILEAAVTVFSRKGLHQARMDDIVEESGLSKGALYWYYKSKDEIIVAIIENMFAEEFNLQISDEPHIKASKRIESYFQHMMENISRMLSLLPLTFEFYSLAFREEKVREFLKSYLTHYMESLVPIIQQGMEDGEFSSAVSPVDAAIALGALFEGVLLVWIFDPQLVDPDHHFESSMKIFMNGLLVRND